MTDYGYPSAPQAYQDYSTGPPLAGWWYRVGATIIDNIITGGVGLIVAVVVSSGGSSVRQLLIALVGVIYTVALLGGNGGRTVGNLAVGTAVVPVSGAGQVGYGTALLRWFVQEILAITIIGGLLDIFWPLWDGKNQTLHDKAASTLVIKPNGMRR